MSGKVMSYVMILVAASAFLVGGIWGWGMLVLPSVTAWVGIVVAMCLVGVVQTWLDYTAYVRTATAARETRLQLTAPPYTIRDCDKYHENPAKPKDKTAEERRESCLRNNDAALEEFRREQEALRARPPPGLADFLDDGMMLVLARFPIVGPLGYWVARRLYATDPTGFVSGYVLFFSIMPLVASCVVAGIVVRATIK